MRISAALDLIGRDAIVLRDGKQITEFREGLLPWALQTPTALVFDEYDAGRPDVMFVIQRVLETEGKLTLLDQNRVIRPNPYFRMFATANTVGLGDTSGLYHGTQADQSGPDGPLEHRRRPQLSARASGSRNCAGQELAGRCGDVGNMVKVADLTRQGLHQRRYLDCDEPAHGDHLGAEYCDLQGYRLCVPLVSSSTNAMRQNALWSLNIINVCLAKICRKASSARVDGLA